MIAKEKIVEDKSQYPMWVRGVLGVLQCWLYVYDCIVYVPFLLFANPYEKLYRSNRQKAKPIKDGDPGSPWKNVDAEKELCAGKYPECKTMDQAWDRAVREYANMPCMGTRQILSVEQELQPNGRSFEKYILGDEYEWESYAEIGLRVDAVGSGLLASGHKTGQPVVIFSETRAEWMTTALACFRYGFPVVTVYATLGEEAIAHALNETEAVSIVCSEELVNKVITIIPKCDKLERMVFFPSPRPDNKPTDISAIALPREFHIQTFTDLQTLGNQKGLKREKEPLPRDTSVIMYTSGTTGLPKGVVISHANIVASSAAQAHVIPNLGTGDTYIGYLPLAHVLELGAEFACLSHGVNIGYSSPLTLHDQGSKIKKGTKGDCSVLKPTLLAAVPTIMDRIYKAVTDKVRNSNPMRQALFHFLYERKRAKIEEGYDNPFLNRLVFSHIKAILGGETRMILSGGAPLNAETQRFMNICFCCPVGQGYGLTETCGAGTICPPDDLSTGRVGPPLICNFIKLRDWSEAGYTTENTPYPQGEILISGHNVVSGYLKNPKKTAEDFIELEGRRWFATGDIGEIHADGSIKIIDRKKDLLKLAHGEYVSLARVETTLMTCPLVDNICVYGNSFETFLVALVVPAPKALADLAKKVGVTGEFEELCGNKAVVAEFVKELQAHGKKGKLEKFEIPQKITLCTEVWTPAMDLLTEAMKLKRRPIENKYKADIDRMYGK